MQALNWLLRSVTQPACLHDLLWWFVTALTPLPPDPDGEGEEDNNKTERKDEHVSCRVITKAGVKISIILPINIEEASRRIVETSKRTAQSI